MKHSFNMFLACFSSVLFVSVTAFGQWTQQSFPSSEGLWKVRFVDSTTGWILGNNFVYKTSDGGSSWVTQDSSIGPGLALTALNKDTVYYANFTGVPPYTRGLRRTTDGGTVWKTVDTLSLFWTGVTFVNDNIGFACGATVPAFHPIVRKTTDGGASWFTTWTGTGTYEIEGMHFFDANHGWTATYDGALQETTDGGVTWIVRDSVPNYPVRDITFATPDSGWAVGGISGISLVVRTTDAGLHWAVQTFSGSSLREVRFFNSKVGWFAGAVNGPPFLAHTIDGGQTWTTQNQVPFSYEGVESFSMVDTNVGWAVNTLGQVYRTTNGGLTSVSKNTVQPPSEIALYQNYPNPFNPTTVIRFSLPSAGNVSLKVIDILGREVATLVAGERQAGTYWETWDASNKASGVYFCRLKVNDFIAVNRMVLMK